MKRSSLKRGKPLARTTGLARTTALSYVRSKRDWTAPRAKVREEAQCRNCAVTTHLQAAHIIPRSRVTAGDGGEDPLNIVPLCARCHRDQHLGRLELLPLLTLPEQAFAAGLVGIANAYRRLTNERMVA